MKITKRKFELLITSISYFQLHLQKDYLLETNDRGKIECLHNELSKISSELINEVGKYDKES